MDFVGPDRRRDLRNLLRKIGYLPQGRAVMVGMPSDADLDCLLRGNMVRVWRMIAEQWENERLVARKEEKDEGQNKLEMVLEKKLGCQKQLILEMRNASADAKEKHARNEMLLEKCNIYRNRIEEETRILNDIRSSNSFVKHLELADESSQKEFRTLFQSAEQLLESFSKDVKSGQQLLDLQTFQDQFNRLNSVMSAHKSAEFLCHALSQKSAQLAEFEKESLRAVENISSQSKHCEEMLQASLDRLDEQVEALFLQAEEFENTAESYKQAVSVKITERPHLKRLAGVVGLRGAKASLLERREALREELCKRQADETWLKNAEKCIEQNQKVKDGIDQQLVQVLESIRLKQQKLQEYSFRLDSAKLNFFHPEDVEKTCEQWSNSPAVSVPMKEVEPADPQIDEHVREMILDHLAEQIEICKDIQEDDRNLLMEHEYAKFQEMVQNSCQSLKEMISQLETSMENVSGIKQEFTECYKLIETWKELPIGNIDIRDSSAGSLSSLKKRFQKALERAENSIRLDQRSVGSHNPESLSFSPIPKRPRQRF